jgi:hypothetical protein
MISNHTARCASPPAALRATGTRALLAELVDVLRELRKAVLDPYRPARHYMRGPGPKWRERHALAGTLRPAWTSTALPATAPLP